ncbi:MAG: ABC transporter ATP-binding protein [Candidatus Tectimicrobiota bacterium]
MNTPEAQPQVLLEVSHLARRFGMTVALHDVSLRVEAGTTYAAIGANGSGKTTTLRILAGLLSADAGTGHILGVRLPGRLCSIRAQVGYMTQHYSLYQHLSVQENLLARARLYSLPQPRQAVGGILEQCSLTAVARRRVSTLSGGWMRRVQFAAVLVHQPSLLLLDEPTAGLDMESKQYLWESIDALAAAGKGIIVSTHDLAEAAACHTIGVFVEGAIAAQGEARTLIERSAAHVWQVPTEHTRARLLQYQLPDVVLIQRANQHYRCVFRGQPATASVAWLQGPQSGALPVPATLSDALALLTRSRGEWPDAA